MCKRTKILSLIVRCRRSYILNKHRPTYIFVALKRLIDLYIYIPGFDSIARSAELIGMWPREVKVYQNLFPYIQGMVYVYCICNCLVK